MFCNKCEFSNEDRYIGPEGSTTADVVIVGESPGTTELITGSPFTGYSGGLLNWFLVNSGIIKNSERRQSVYITNAVKCYPSNRHNVQTKDLEGQTIKKHHVMACRGKLAAELKRVKPKIIISLGSIALQSIFNDFSLNISKRTGFFYYSEEFNCFVRPLIHPAAILRNWGYTDQTIICMDRIKRALVEEFKIPELPKYTLCESLKDVKKVFRILSKAKVIAFDTETSSLNYWDKKEDILGFSFCWGEGKAAWVPLYKTGKDGRVKMWSEKDEAKVLTMIRIVLEDTSIKKIGQNIKFDINWCEHYNIKVKNIAFDTLQVHHLINENTPSNLTYLTSYYDIGFPPYEFTLSEYISSNNPKYENIPSRVLGIYCAADADATYRIAFRQVKLLSKQQLRLYNMVSVELSKLARELEWNGTLVDVPAISTKEKEYELDIKKQNSALAITAKMDSINVASPKQLQHLLFEKLKLKSNKKTKTGNQSTDAEVMDNLQVKYSKNKKVLKILKFIKEIKTMRKMKSTYLTGMKKLVDESGRLHTSCLTTGTVTGRMTTRNPSLQTCPKDPLFRSLFIAGPGRKLIISDYCQIEAKLLAFVAGETKLIKKFAELDFDIHSFNASAVLNIPIEDITKEQRRHAKSVTFGINYGRSSKSIAEEYELDLDGVIDFVEGYFNTYKKIDKFRKYQKSMARKNLITTNFIGRIRHFSGFLWSNSDEMADVSYLHKDNGISTYVIEAIELGMERQAMNFPIQSYAHDILVQAIGRMRKEFKKQGLDINTYLVIHDEVVFDSAEKDSKKCLEIVKRLMPVTKTLKSGLSIDFTIEAKMADNWAG